MASAAAELEQKKREIFVRNLSYDTTSDELIELFQEIGPIKRGSVTQKDGVSRGFGFIKFALEEDAQSAIAQMNGREYKGRHLIIETAVNKGQNPLTDGATTAADGTVTAVRAQKASRVSISADTPKLIDLGDAKSRKLQLVIFGVSAAFGKKTFRKYLKSLSRKATVQVITTVRECMYYCVCLWLAMCVFPGVSCSNTSIYPALFILTLNSVCVGYAGAPPVVVD